MSQMTKERKKNHCDGSETLTKGNFSQSVSVRQAFLVHFSSVIGLALASWMARDFYSIDLVSDPAPTLRLFWIVHSIIAILIYSGLRLNPENCSYFKAVGRGLLSLPIVCPSSKLSGPVCPSSKLSGQFQKETASHKSIRKMQNSSASFPSQNTLTSYCRGISPRISILRGGSSNSKYQSTQFSLSSENGGVTMKSQGVGPKDAVIIVDHGSRRKESNLMLNDFVAMFRDKTGYPIVEPAHMELAEPSIKDAFGLCVEQGANRVIVSPFFLFPGRHWHQDIPSLTAEAAKEHPGVPYVITAPLGLHELLVDVVNDRIKHCLSHVAGDADECAVCAGTSKCKLY